MSANRTRGTARFADPARIGDEHARYASWLARGSALGFAVMAIGFLAYVGGVIDPHVAFDQLPSLWGEPAARYREATGLHEAWSWVGLLHKADMLNLAGVAILSGCSVAALLSVVPLYARKRNRLFVGVCLLEAAIIVLAASDLVSGGH